jgi:2-oxoglutarate ferredoxin oxidoreductase subunit delta
MGIPALAERIRSLLPTYQHGSGTDHVLLDLRRCEACWECVDVCPQGVLAVISFGPHRHAVVEHPDDCTGCLACTNVCEAGALTRHDPP